MPANDGEYEHTPESGIFSDQVRFVHDGSFFLGLPQSCFITKLSKSVRLFM